jgi:hypothetical protein
LSTIFTIPSDVLPDVREGLFCLMGDATQGLDQALIFRDRELHPEWFADDRRQLERVFAMLDLIGWEAGTGSRAVEVELGEYGQTLKEALGAYLPILEDQEAEANVEDKGRADKGKPPLKNEISGRVAALRELTAFVEEQHPR